MSKPYTFEQQGADMRLVEVIPKSEFAKLNRITLWQHDPRHVLSPAFARSLAKQLIEAAEQVEREGL